MSLSASRCTWRRNSGQLMCGSRAVSRAEEIGLSGSAAKTSSTYPWAELRLRASNRSISSGSKLNPTVKRARAPAGALLREVFGTARDRGELVDGVRDGEVVNVG